MKPALIVALALMAVAPAAAQAEPWRGDNYSVVVSYRGLDLARDADARLVLQRIRSAALHLCGGADFVEHFRDTAFIEGVYGADCYNNTVSRAVARLDAPAVTALLDAAAPAAGAKR